MPLYRFGIFELDSQDGALTRSGRRVHLPPQPFKVLLLLVERGGGLVTRDELRAALWGADTHVDFERGLSFAMNRVRVALGDSGHRSRFIETVPRRGYRCVVPVVSVTAAVQATCVPDPEPPPPAPRAPTTAPRGARPHPTALLLALLLLVGLAPDRSPRGAGWDAYERGLAETRAGDLRPALLSLQQAARLLPEVAAVHVARADVYTRLGRTGALRAREAFPAARAAADRALEIADSAEARVLRGNARFLYDWDRAGARADFERALELSPDSLPALVAYARLLSASGDHARAIDVIGHAEALDAGDRTLHEAGWVHYRAHRPTDAVRRFRQAGALPPSQPGAVPSWAAWNRFLVLLVHRSEGDVAAAAEDVAEFMRERGVTEEQIVAARREPARMVERFLDGCVSFTTALSERQYVPPVQFAFIHAARGNDDRALEALRLAVTERTPDVAWSLGDPLFDGLRGRPDFRELQGRVAPQPGPSRGPTLWASLPR